MSSSSSHALVGTSFFAVQEIQHEEDVTKRPYILSGWLNYLLYKKDAASTQRYIIYERALSFLPRSYKLWYAYLQEREGNLKHRCFSSSPTDKKIDTLVHIYERALVHMNKMPRIWMDYCNLLARMKRGSMTRRTFDRALKALPVTQHKRIWDLYIQWAKDFGVEETTIRVYRRFLMFDATNREEYVDFLVERNYFEEAARQLAICVDDEHYIPPSGKTKHQLWMNLCNICANNPEETSRAIDVESVIRSGIGKFTDEVGRLWCRLADFYIKQGNFEKARDIFEEAIHSVITVRDFSVVFDTYVNVEERIVTEKMQILQERQEASAANGEDDNDDDFEEYDAVLETADIDIRLERLEYIMDQRPLLVNSVILRQNPHNIHEWLKRSKLYKDNNTKKVMTLVEAIRSVDPTICNGKFSNLWLALAENYENQGDADNARAVYKKASEVNFKSVEELANLYCAWGEFELKDKKYSNALRVLQLAVKEPVLSNQRRAALAAAQGKGINEDFFEGSVSSDRLYKNTKVWKFYLDLEESLGTVETCRAAYERVMDLKVITAQMLLNYADFLETNNFFEDSFKVYQRGVELFIFPQVKAIWVKYIDTFIKRYAGSKLERLRDLFEQSVINAPSNNIAELYIKYAKAEESFGMNRQAMSIYDRATKLVPLIEKLDMYRLYIKKTELLFGITKTRPIYDRAVAELREDMSRSICLDYAGMERKLGEIDRARAILEHGSQYADPRRDKAYWKIWREFEEAHGNVDTFKDMLRVQRSVEAAFSQVNYLAADMLADNTIAQSTLSDMEAIAKRAEQDAIESSQNLGLARNFVPKTAVAAVDTTNNAKSSSSSISSNNGNSNQNLSHLHDDEEEEEENSGFVQKPIPSAVFGSMMMDS